jgi:hypothetical protein
MRGIQGYEFMTVYDTIVSMGSESMHVPVCPVYMEFTVVVEGNGGTNDKSIWEGQSSVRVADVNEVLLSLTTVKNVMVSMNEDSCHWTGEVPAGRVKGRTIKWVSKSRGREQLSIEWKLGIRDDGYVPGQVTYDATRNIGLASSLSRWRSIIDC